MTSLDKLHELLMTDWQTSESLCNEFGWKPHSLRGRISNVAVKFEVKIERCRIDGVTSYRIAAATTAAEVDAASVTADVAI